MKTPHQDIPQLNGGDHVGAQRGPTRRVRRLLHGLRVVWIGLFGSGTIALAYFAATGPAAIRVELGLIGALSLLMLLFLYREDQAYQQARRRERYLWHRLRDLSQIFEVSLGVRSLDDVRKLSGLGLQETMLLMRAELGAIVLHESSGEDHLTALGFEDRGFDHRPWIVELQGLLKDHDGEGPVIVADIDHDPRCRETVMLQKAGFGSLVALPFAGESESAGLMVVGNPASTEFGRADARTFEQATRQMQSLLKHGRKLDALGEQIDDLKHEIDELTYANQAKSEFASVASHELKTPLTAVKASVDTLLANLRAGDFGAMEEFLHLIREEADRLIEMTGKILEISALDYSNRVMERRPVRLRPIVDSCAQALEVHLQEKDMHLVVDVDLGLPLVFADPGMIRQVLINLIGNAVKFSSSGQTVTVSARRHGPSLEVLVRDQGSGIPEEEQPHIFERFYQGTGQGDNHIQSTGLGLAIVKEIVEQHQGHVGVKSAPGAGAAFGFDLPLARGEAGMQGSPLRVQPMGEVEEFLRLAVDWIAFVVRADAAQLRLVLDGELQRFHASEEGEEGVHAESVAEQAYSLETAILLEEDGGEGGSTIGVPLSVRDEVLGCFVTCRSGADFHQEDLLLVEGIVERIGRVIGEAADSRDPGRILRKAGRAVRDLLQGGQRRVPAKVDPSMLAWELAERVGASNELSRDVRLATNFHDVAMAQIGMEIEKQERPLNEEELAKLRQHPRQAAQLLSDIASMEAVSRIVMHHHEWFNGQGYPDGLSGEGIPLGSRIVAVIDAYCSMTAPRKYKPVHDPLTAARELVNCSGRQFDPQLITGFLELLRDRGWVDGSDAESLLREHANAAALGAPMDVGATVETVPADNDSEEGSW